MSILEFNGVWKLNFAKSDIPPITKSQILNIETDGFHVTMREELINDKIPKSSQVSIKVFNVLGSEIETLVNEEKPASTYELNWNASNLPSGVYFYRLQAGDFVQTRKMILLK